MHSIDTSEINSDYDEQDGYEGQYPPDWKARKEIIHKRNDYACTECETQVEDRKKLHTHHIQSLPDGGSNRLSNLTSVCVDCYDRQHADNRHNHDVRQELEGTSQSFGELGWWLYRLMYYSIGGMGIFILHVVGIYVLLTQPVEESVWMAGGGYVVLLVTAVGLYPESIAVLYGIAGIIMAAIMQVVAVNEIGTISANIIVLSTWLPALLACGWWWRQR